ncbi:hypothetical protein IB236_08665 [Acidovorax sp. ACV02]|uniref:hypothetical protein n=1 Tax=Acidovorax sp. ACV02 TaxID=2769310 RepID=UPI001786DFBD|nr:hypothetical protein [Acidovorax sp. ACV02]MBD9405404.1 hypothetical protein [Acidovorax sp. ACV02]
MTKYLGKLSAKQNESWRFWAKVVGVLGAVVLAWGLWGGFVAGSFLRATCKDCTADLTSLGQFGDLFGGINALFSALGFGVLAMGTMSAYQTYRDERRWIRDEKYSEQAQRSFEWAYDALTDGGKHVPPAPHRLNWLTSARHILRAQKIALLIQSPEILILFQENEEYWRHQFYLALEHPQLANSSYFARSGGVGIYVGRPVGGLGIDEMSALVVVKFSRWKEGAEDPMKQVTQLSFGDEFNGYPVRGLTEHLKNISTPSSEKTGSNSGH